MSNTSKNADMPAMPIEFSGFGLYAPEAFGGLTKREEFAKTAMLGLLSNPSMIDSVTNPAFDFIVEASIRIADKILIDLEKQQ